MNPFEAGDRVVVYSGLSKYKAIVEMVDGEHLHFSSIIDYWVHYKQCRKLKPKKLAPPRRFWINTYQHKRWIAYTDAYIADKYGEVDRLECIPVIELTDAVRERLK